MGERENALSQGEVVPYTEVTEEDAQSLINKREINRRSNNGITVVAYWLMRENICLIYVHDARNNGSAEFEVPNDTVMDNFNHPFANPGSWEVPQYRQAENHE